MKLDPTACWRALSTRDARFDGVFFVGVRSTGIYCRPVCSARTPRPERCRYFRTACEAEKAGFRSCLRCRPELAPGESSVDAVSRIAAAGLARIEAGALDELGLEGLAHALGTSGRHLRRALVHEFGVAPIEIALTRRLQLAKELVCDTELPLTEVAFASGFQSVRRFNAAFRARFERTPTELRRRPPTRARASSFEIRLGYRKPFAWTELLAFLAARATRGVEHVDELSYARTVSLRGARGWIRVRDDAERGVVRVEIASSLARVLAPLSARLKSLFDLDAHPLRIGAVLAQDPELQASLARRPGLRVPGSFDAFETTARAILGQQVSVRGASTLAARCANTFGEALITPFAELDRLAPTPSALADAGARALQALGLPGARAATLHALARAFATGALSLEASSPGDLALLQSIAGIGPWTAEYVRMRVLRDPDAFPSGDLVLRRAMSATHARELEQRAERWRPFRAYAALHLWSIANDNRTARGIA